MRSTILASFVLGLLFISCKDDKKTDAATEVKEKPFTVTVNAIVKKDDVFQIFYNEDGSEAFAPADAVTINVKGMDTPQDLVFEVPEDVSPVSLRFDIGATKDQNEVFFKSLKVSNRDKSFSAEGAKVLSYFYPNTQTEFDTVNVSAKILPSKDGVYDPVLGSTQLMKDEIAKLYPAKK